MQVKVKVQVQVKVKVQVQVQVQVQVDCPLPAIHLVSPQQLNDPMLLFPGGQVPAVYLKLYTVYSV